MGLVYLTYCTTTKLRTLNPNPNGAKPNQTQGHARVRACVGVGEGASAVLLTESPTYGVHACMAGAYRFPLRSLPTLPAHLANDGLSFTAGLVEQPIPPFQFQGGSGQVTLGH